MPLKFHEKIIWVLAIIAICLALLVWARLDLAGSIFHTTEAWIYANLGMSKAWSFTLAFLSALLVSSNLGLLLFAVVLGRQRDVTRLMVFSMLTLVPGTFIYELNNRSQCFDRATDAPLCTLYQKPDGTFVLHKNEDAAPPSAWSRIRTASKQDVHSSFGDEMPIPKRINLKICMPEADFFDRVTAEPKVYFAKVDNLYELFDRPGFHPQTRALLEPVTKKSVHEICEALIQEKNAAEKAASEAKATEDAKAAEAAKAADYARAMAQERRERAVREEVEARTVVVTQTQKVFYWCSWYRAYYPYVSTCPTPWQIVVEQ